MRTLEYRLYPNREQSRLLLACLTETRKRFNEMLETIKAQSAEKGTFLTKYDLTVQFEGRGDESVPAVHNWRKAS